MMDRTSSVSCGTYALGGTPERPFGVTLNLSGLCVKIASAASMYVHTRTIVNRSLRKR